MNEKSLELFNSNYENEGICKDLPKFLKKFTKEFKKESKDISYYPWAVIERLFRSQGGTIEVEEWVCPVSFKSMDMIPNEEGEFVMQEVETNALFIHLVAQWEDEELDEMYPLFDNQNAKVMKTPNAMDLNTSRQRGSVRLIARISGIGLSVFEQQDTQFDDDSGGLPITEKKDGEPVVDKKVVKKPTTRKPRRTKAQIEADNLAKEKEIEKAIEEGSKEVEVDKKDKEAEDVKVVVNKDEPDPEGAEFMDNFLKGGQVKVEEEGKVATIDEAKKDFEEGSFEKDTQEYADLLLAIRKIIRDKKVQKEAKALVVEQGETTLSALDYDQLSELKTKLG